MGYKIDYNDVYIGDVHRLNEVITKKNTHIEYLVESEFMKRCVLIEVSNGYVDVKKYNTYKFLFNALRIIGKDNAIGIEIEEKLSELVMPTSDKLNPCFSQETLFVDITTLEKTEKDLDVKKLKKLQKFINRSQ